ncbi:unnamed protein product, partial [Prunus brigantina]
HPLSLLFVICFIDNDTLPFIFLLFTQSYVFHLVRLSPIIHLRYWWLLDLQPLVFLVEGVFLVSWLVYGVLEQAPQV